MQARDSATARVAKDSPSGAAAHDSWAIGALVRTGALADERVVADAMARLGDRPKVMQSSSGAAAASVLCPNRAGVRRRRRHCSGACAAW